MAKILNLDEFASKEARALSLFGVEYPVNEMSVDDFIEITSTSQRLENEKDMAIQMGETKRLIKLAVPSIDIGALGKLNMDQLSAVSRFIRGDDVLTPAEEAAKKASPEATPGNS